jgi:alpha-tubulin suppressor-like RCC1 family protein
VTDGALSGETVVAVAAGRYNTLALTAAGRLYTWGLDGCAGPVPASAGRHVPRHVTAGGLGDAFVIGVSVGYVHWLALTDDGRVFSCDTGDDGYAATLASRRRGNGEGELGRALANEDAAFAPARVLGALEAQHVVAIAAGRSHSLAATSAGTLFSWGNNQAKQLGREATSGAETSVPALVPLPPRADGSDARVHDVAAGEYFSLASLENGGLLGWGANGNGQLGRGEAAGADGKPDKGPLSMGLASGGTSAPRHVVALAAGYQHAAAIVIDPTAAAAAAAEAHDAPAQGAQAVGTGLVTLMPRTGCVLRSASAPAAFTFTSELAHFALPPGRWCCRLAPPRPRRSGLRLRPRRVALPSRLRRLTCLPRCQRVTQCCVVCCVDGGVGN